MRFTFDSGMRDQEVCIFIWTRLFGSFPFVWNLLNTNSMLHIFNM